MYIKLYVWLSLIVSWIYIVLEESIFKVFVGNSLKNIYYFIYKTKGVGVVCVYR